MTAKPIIAVICHYKMTDSLRLLLQDVSKQAYSAVYVIDDATPGNELKSMATDYPNVHFVFGTTNKGSAGNRNRILKQLSIRLDTAILHFIDADVRLTSDDVVNCTRLAFDDTTVGVVGGLVTLKGCGQMVFNFGPRLSLSSMVLSGIQANRFIRSVCRPLLRDYPNPSNITARSTYWVSEANLLIPFSLFRELGGYDGRLRYHETLELAVRVHAAGKVVRFDPTIRVEHPTSNGRDKHFDSNGLKALIQIVRRHGLGLK